VRAALIPVDAVRRLPAHEIAPLALQGWRRPPQLVCAASLADFTANPGLPSRGRPVNSGDLDRRPHPTESCLGASVGCTFSIRRSLRKPVGSRLAVACYGPSSGPYEPSRPSPAPHSLGRLTYMARPFDCLEQCAPPDTVGSGPTMSCYGPLEPRGRDAKRGSAPRWCAPHEHHLPLSLDYLRVPYGCSLIPSALGRLL